MPDLALTSLTLSHFRSHRRAALSLDGRPVALFGPNGAGKTNVLEAISLLSPGRGLRRAPAEEIARRPEAIGWKVVAEVRTRGGFHDVETFAEAGAARFVTIDGKPAAQTALGRLIRVLWLVPAMDRLWTEGAEGRRRFLDRMTLSFEPGHADTVLAYEKAMRERNRLLKEGIRDQGWYGALERQMAESGAEIMSNRASALARVEAAQSAAETAFPAARLAIIGPADAPDAHSAEDLAQALAAGRPRDLGAGRTLTGPHRSDLQAIYAAKAMPAAQCSTGEQKALLISLVLANARALTDDGTPPILLLDEVAAHLDAHRRAVLYDEISAMDIQAFMTGTGPELFAELGSRAQHFEVTETAGQSAITGTQP